MWKLVALLVLVVAVVVFGFSLIDATGDNGTVDANTLLPAMHDDTSGFARAIAPYDWSFPRDHGPHPEFQTEWWYYTGNLADAEGRRFGYQFTIFRRALTPQADVSSSEWRTNQVYLAHFTVTDAEDDHFYHQEHYSRGSADLAGAAIDPTYRVWLEGWQIAAQNEDATTLTIQADGGEMAVDFTLDEAKAPVLQGDAGLSAKSPEPGNASYYYSVPRYATEGTITVGGEAHEVSGTTWMDHEFSTSALGTDALGWDWFGLQLEDNRELMVGYIRLSNGERRSYGGLLVEPDGSTRSLTFDEFSIESTGTWTSPHSNVTYPAGWEISVDTGEGDPLDITLTPLVSDQELQAAVTTYWEGAVRITGDATGYGYAELTGYRDELAARF
jgi:predicted secreted hydrolase